MINREITSLTDLLTIIHGLEKLGAKYSLRVIPEASEKERHYQVEVDAKEQDLVQP